jgi:hypothetical protein
VVDYLPACHLVPALAGCFSSSISFFYIYIILLHRQSVKRYFAVFSIFMALFCDFCQ